MPQLDANGDDDLDPADIAQVHVRPDTEPSHHAVAVPPSRSASSLWAICADRVRERVRRDCADQGSKVEACEVEPPVNGDIGVGDHLEELYEDNWKAVRYIEFSSDEDEPPNKRAKSRKDELHELLELVDVGEQVQ